MDDAARRAFALKLREHRRRAGLTLEELGRRCGLGAATLAHMEAGRRRPLRLTVAKLARCLKVPLPELLGAPAPARRRR